MAEDKRFLINKIYVKNVSFEAPNSPGMFAVEFKPKMDVNLNVESYNIENDIYHVMVRVTVTVKIDDKTAFLCEVDQAGVFTIANFEQAELGYMLGSQCPNILFPFARETVSDLVVRGGFPQLLLEPVNFDALYANHMQQKQAQGEQADESSRSAVQNEIG
ncbi:protein-export chaperone SecB [Thiomicrospira sp. ALE5]|uniref:protein-export chaperone SecB n=1 Tax=Thiomicrospira sp. ALE5 TaxID=748650 RepID=UPI0008E069B4|nr:protein-export chaperone SecB [Thiomicrospira sp. ALE5]SFR63358.1 preprotein translocase subunit SecB [Thiomicrospira sp. ALE5]